MNVLFDTSILIPALVEAHPAHKIVVPWFQRVRTGVDSGFIGAHSLAELYSYLTKAPLQPRISPAHALQMIERNVITNFKVIELSHIDYINIITHTAKRGLAGGVIYDALIVYAGIKTKVDQIITLNNRDFSRIYPEFADKIVIPQ